MLWSGFVARTAPGWSLLIRPPANLTRSLGYESYEGIIETDRWFGPLFVNLRLTRPNVPIEFDANYPFLQVQPVHRSVYGDALDGFEIVERIEDLHAIRLGRLPQDRLQADGRPAPPARRIRCPDAQAPPG